MFYVVTDVISLLQCSLTCHVFLVLRNGQWAWCVDGSLQLAIDKAEERGPGISPRSKDETLRVVFWKGLSREFIKMAIRHKYDTLGSFDELVRVARLVEQEGEDFKKFHN